MDTRVVLMTASALRLAISRMAHEIAEANAAAERLVLLGIQTGGVHLATRLSTELGRLLGHAVPAGQLDVSLHRDDLHQRPAPAIHPTNLPGDLTGASVILTDDVLFSGRTVRAALDAMHDYGRPGRVQLAVLVDRHGHRHLPVQADFVARKLPTRPGQRVDVQWAEDGGDDCVYLNPP
ncbi:MAG: bifunctional pyr operon transcriptional regulator/uracil phosphoribosyltransferase PyrR [Verrucomicrobiales bacterium]|nr:bifunctional pyr operon transcriptional regulator/uracil phosphoribosyltransferase PyrR [Verrucomicrobiales bacterium]